MDIHPAQCCYGGQADGHGFFTTKEDGSTFLESAARVCSVRPPREAESILRGPPREAKPRKGGWPPRGLYALLRGAHHVRLNAFYVAHRVRRSLLRGLQPSLPRRNPTCLGEATAKTDEGGSLWRSTLLGLRTIA